MQNNNEQQNNSEPQPQNITDTSLGTPAPVNPEQPVLQTPIMEQPSPVQSVENSEVTPSVPSSSAPLTNGVANQPVQPQQAPPVTENPLYNNGNSLPVEKSPSRKGLYVVLAIFLVALLGAGGFAGWYFGLRTPDSEYDKAVAVVDTMISDVKAIESKRTEKGTVSTSASLTAAKLSVSDTATNYATKAKEFSDLKESAAEYLTNASTLQQLPALTKNASVKAIYDTGQKTINDYSTSSDSVLKTFYVFFSMMQRCSVISDAGSLSNSDVTKYDLAVKPCRDYLAANATVQSKDFNDTFYVPYRKVLLNLLDSSHDYLAATTKAQQTAASNALLKVLDDLSKIDTSKVDTVDISKSPNDQLQHLRDKLVEQKAVLFR